MIVAYYFTMIIATQLHPLLVGPYFSFSDCASVREYQDRRGYETGGCGLMPFPQEDAVLLGVIVIP